MKVFGITCGRKNGNTELMMKELFLGVQEIDPEAECNFVNLQEAEIVPCRGCEACVIHHLKGDLEFRCVTPKNKEHFYFIEQYMRAADAIIVSAPAYNLLPPGILITFLNKLHASGDYRNVVAKNTKIGAVFSIGGTDWTNLTLPPLKMMCMEFVGSFDSIVDAYHVNFVPSTGAILLEDDAMNRIHQMGMTVARSVIDRSSKKTVSFHGDKGICPDCHSRLMEIREDGCYCPVCETKMSVNIVNGKLSVNVTEEQRARNRWSAWGRSDHDHNISKNHEKAAKGKEIISERRKKYEKTDYKLKLPRLNVEGENHDK